jgi:hypothetical protein
VVGAPCYLRDVVVRERIVLFREAQHVGLVRLLLLLHTIEVLLPISEVS